PQQRENRWDYQAHSCQQRPIAPLWCVREGELHHSWLNTSPATELRHNALLSHSRRKTKPRRNQRAANLSQPPKTEGRAAVGCRERVSQIHHLNWSVVRFEREAEN